MTIYFTANEAHDLANRNSDSIANLEAKIMYNILNAAKQGKYYCACPIIKNVAYFHQIVNILEDNGFTVFEDEDNDEFIVNW